MNAARYAKLLWVQARASFATSMQYRIDFFVQGAMSLFWLGWHLIPLVILFDRRESVAGWSFDEALVVIGWFTALRGLLDGVINPSLVDTVDRIRTGSFDYVLLKPADAQFLVSTARFQPWKVVDVAGGMTVIAIALTRLGRAPSAAELAVGAAMMAASTAMLYALWMIVVSLAFWVVKLDNLTYMFSAVFDAARWPVHVFRGAWRFVFTFVLPLAVMTTYPAMALLGTLRATTALWSAAGALAALALSRAVWRAAIATYTSASS
ncbi:MAG: ABC transporter permease [Deltaproteobacteria bacterium]|nr:MAG: ABC transporter permease [Deltaproteobacteria bacterium]